jgi:sugar lactone lactonase YvrE
MFQIVQGGGPSYIPTSYTSTQYGLCCGFSGDGGPIGNALVSSPFGIAFDSSGNLYFADTYNQRIRRVDANGIVTTVAGGGSNGLGDGGPPTSATLSQPVGIAIDANGGIYIADMGHNRIRKVANNAITTIAGTGVAGYSGDNGPGSQAQINTPLASSSMARALCTSRTHSTIGSGKSHQQGPSRPLQGRAPRALAATVGPE